MKSTSHASGDHESGYPTSNVRTVITLVLVVHGFFALVAVSSVFAPSPLQLQILNRFKPYTRLLNFDLNSYRDYNFRPYYLTHASELDVDHRIEVLPEGGNAQSADDWLVLPSGGFRGSDAYKRLQRFAGVWAIASQSEGEPARFAQAVGTHFARQRAVKPQLIRCRRHFLQSQQDIAGASARRNPFDPSFFAVVYAANAIVGESGYVEVVRVDETGQVALPTGTNRSSNSTSGANTPTKE